MLHRKEEQHAELKQIVAEISSIAGRDKLVQNVMAGIGGGDVRPHHIKEIIADVHDRQEAGRPIIMEDLQ